MKFKLQSLQKVFKTYDIRGIIGDVLDENFYYYLARALSTYLNAKTIVVGRDFRDSSVKFYEAFINGLIDSGTNAIELNEIPTEVLYFTVGILQGKVDGGVTITASHNPSEYNGCKMVFGDVSPIFMEKGMSEIIEIMREAKYKKTNAKGKRIVQSIDPFIEFIQSNLKNIEIPRLKIAIDAGNGLGGKFFDIVFGDLPFEVHRMYFEPDSSFPNHVPDPLKIENTLDLTNTIKNGEYDLGIALDGDSDRVFFFDKFGNASSGLYTGSMIAEFLLKSYPGEIILHDARVNRAIRETVIKAGGKPMVSVSGHAYFKQSLKKYNAIFGAEQSSHFFYRDFFYADSAFYTMSLFFKMYSFGFDFAEKLKFLIENYPVSGEVNFKVQNIDETLQKIENSLDLKPEKVDGLSYHTDKWSANIRKSNTEPILRLNVEGNDINSIIEGFRLFENLIGGERLNNSVIDELN
ncbi:MAG: phosphomannomutase [Candidatus Dojkabacteria bacterium]|nr:MAG: phosphomannomutase [Candidatus Dojkabacteria bacterium]